MNHKTLFILGLALVTVAAAMGVRIALTSTDSDSAEHARITDDPQPHQTRASSNFDRPMNLPQHEHRPTPSAAREATERAPFAIGLPDGAGPELIERAEAVERHANHELERLTRRLDLSVHQRARLFPILAAGSADYHPAMTGPGLSHADVARVRNGELGIDDVLTPAQQDERIAGAMDDNALWREIFENLKRQLDAETPELPEAPADGQPNHGRRNLYDLVDP